MSDRGQKSRRRGGELLNHVVAKGRALLVSRLNADESTAHEVARELAIELARDFGGQFFYFPKDLADSLTRRDRDIFARYNGRNIPELAAQFHLSEVRLYQIIDRVRREELSRRQARLPGLDEPA